MERLGLLTSGGDAPGMNAAIRSITRTALAKGLEVIGIQRGYKGLLQGDLETLNIRSVSNIIQRGGTILRTARSKEFMTGEGVKKGAQILKNNRIEGLIIIGGDGSFRGAFELGKVWGGRIIGIPGTIDNDLWGTDFTIGYDTAINTALEAIDKIRDTADAHERFFLVEVMGRQAGFIALDVAIAGGAEEFILPEISTDIQDICERLCVGKERGKTSSIIIVAEGAEAGGAFQIAEDLRKLSQYEYRVVILGHLQRGGAPTARDRVLATKLGAFAVEAILSGENMKMVGEINGRLSLTPLENTWKRKKSLDSYLMTIHNYLCR
jgi:6-phosphofructokinase 1